ncbi:MAG: MurR/RpiR family transcriptional regulator [Oceanospirillales bacterium]|nr:MAG: MurR/RpiR family transcriptional regulator [Oceanospirillales bacterium]
MSPSHAPTFLSRIRASLASLHPSERRLADTLLSFPGEVASYSATELAQLANVSNATVTRFVRRLGYKSFEEARQAARVTQQSGAAVFQSPASKQEPESALAAHIEQGRVNVANSFAELTLAEIDSLAVALLKARRVWIVGFRTAHAFAIYLNAQIGQIVTDVMVLPQSGQTLAESLCSIEANDVVIAFALRRPVKQMEYVFRELSGTEARCAVITDSPIILNDNDDATLSGTPLDSLLSAEWSLRVHTMAPGPLFNHAAVLTLCHLIATRVLELSGPNGRRRLLNIEAMHDALDEM